jgi:hypothetical protein
VGAAPLFLFSDSSTRSLIPIRGRTKCDPNDIDVDHGRIHLTSVGTARVSVRRPIERH